MDALAFLKHLPSQKILKQPTYKQHDIVDEPAPKLREPRVPRVKIHEPYPIELSKKTLDAVKREQAAPMIEVPFWKPPVDTYYFPSLDGNVPILGKLPEKAGYTEVDVDASSAAEKNEEIVQSFTDAPQRVPHVGAAKEMPPPSLEEGIAFPPDQPALTARQQRRLARLEIGAHGPTGERNARQNRAGQRLDDSIQARTKQAASVLNRDGRTFGPERVGRGDNATVINDAPHRGRQPGREASLRTVQKLLTEANLPTSPQPIPRRVRPNTIQDQVGMAVRPAVGSLRAKWAPPREIQPAAQSPQADAAGRFRNPITGRFARVESPAAPAATVSRSRRRSARVES